LKIFYAGVLKPEVQQLKRKRATSATEQPSSSTTLFENTFAA
jgi:hypothetical protein